MILHARSPSSRTPMARRSTSTLTPREPCSSKRRKPTDFVARSLFPWTSSTTNVAARPRLTPSCGGIASLEHHVAEEPPVAVFTPLDRRRGDRRGRRFPALRLDHHRPQ